MTIPVVNPTREISQKEHIAQVMFHIYINEPPRRSKIFIIYKLIRNQMPDTRILTGLLLNVIKHVEK